MCVGEGFGTNGECSYQVWGQSKASELPHTVLCWLRLLLSSATGLNVKTSTYLLPYKIQFVSLKVIPFLLLCQHGHFHATLSAFLPHLGHKADMNVAEILVANSKLKLSKSLHKRHALNVANSTTKL